jgi:hypothetical protein
MKNATFFFLLSLFFGEKNSAQSLTFSRTMGGENYDDARGLVAANDGNFVFTGLTKSASDSFGTMYLTKINAVGLEIWTRHFDRLKEDGGNSLLATHDGGFLISGHTALSIGDECDGYLLRTDADGHELWRTLVGDELDDVSNASVETADGSFFTVGRAEDPNSETFRMLFAKISSDGKVVFLKKIGGEQPCLAYQIAQNMDGNLFLAGYNYFTDGRATQMRVVKISQNGEIFWEKSIENWPGGRARQILPTPDGGCLALGGTTDSQDHFEKMCLLRFDADGNVSNQKQFPEKTDEKGYLFDGKWDSEGRLMASGAFVSLDKTEKPAVFRFDADLNLLEQKILENPDCRPKSLTICADGSVFLVGAAIKIGDDQSDIFIAKTGQFGQNASSIDLNQVDFLLFPNPISDFTYLKIGQPSSPKMLVITDANGKIIRENKFESSEFLIEKMGLPTGILFFSVKNERGELLKTGRFVSKNN